MCIIVGDSVVVPTLGITISNFKITIKGSYQIVKNTYPVYLTDLLNRPIYAISANAQWIANGGTVPIYTQNFSVSYSFNQLTTLPTSLYATIYAQLGAGFQSVTNDI